MTIASPTIHADASIEAFERSTTRSNRLMIGSMSSMRVQTRRLPRSISPSTLLPELDEHRPQFFACLPQMLCPRSIAGLVLDELIVDDADAMPRQYSQNLTVALAL
jgi:hypothetical protein